MYPCCANPAVTCEWKGGNLSRSCSWTQSVKEVAATNSRPATIVIRKDGSQFNILGPTRFQGGYPIFANGDQDGAFGQWQWNGQRLLARVDRLGMFPLFYSEIPQGIALSTSISELIKAGASSEIDWTALRVLLRVGFCVGCDTVFRAIKAFPVGGELAWEPGQLEVRESFPEIKFNPLSRSEAIDGYIDLFRSAMRKRIVDSATIRLPLSGGRDSRHIMLELVALGSRPACYTSPSNYSTMPNDVGIARQVCEELGLPHVVTRTPENEDIVRTELEKNELISFQALEHGWAWLVAQDMADSEAVTYDGIAGDVLSAGHFHDDENSRLYHAGHYEEVARRVGGLMIITGVTAELPPIRLLIPAKWREAAAAADPCAAIVKELVRYRHTQNPMMFFYLYNRTRRAVNPSVHGLWGSAVRAVYVPYLDREVFDFLAGLPEEMFADKTFHSQAIARAHPQIKTGYAKKTPIRREVYLCYARQGLPFALRTSSPLLDRFATLVLLARSLVLRRYNQDSMWVVLQAVMLHQLGQLQMVRERLGA